MTTTDVVIIGGGPAGSVCAASLRRLGLSVVLLERALFPRFQLGESLLPQSLVILDAIGVLPAVRERFLAKYGARFHDDVATPARQERFSFDGAWKVAYEHAFQVPRADFDLLLLDHARSLGAVVRQPCTATEILHNSHSHSHAHGRAIGVLADGERIEARFVVDATGRRALTARARGGTKKIAGLDQTALYAHFEGVPRPSGRAEGDIDIVLFASQPRDDARGPNWFWFIPFKDGRTSVGAVVSRAWIRRNGASFEAAVAESPSATRLLAGARRLWEDTDAAADFSYRVDAMHGPGWIAVGDAGGFIDPLFSTGVHLALTGAHTGAAAIAQALDTPTTEAELLTAWSAGVRAGAETFILAVEAFYAGPLVEHLFAPDKHEALRRSITSLLAGDVFGEAVWLRDVRKRLAAMTAMTAAITR